MYKEITIQQYLEKAQKVQIIDVRSPKEFNHAHIPGAVNMPLFDDTERAIVGTAYKQEGREIAILKGLEIVGPKMATMVAEIKERFSDKSIILHCWRGGMRSKSVATLFSFCGIRTEVIIGGYKSYRQEVQKLFLQNFEYFILGGRTGSAKTKILQELNKIGEQVIDLEKLANHKGSAFGELGEDPQPTTEMFENLLFEELRFLETNKKIWLEDESHLIGTVFIPETIWQQMRTAPVIYCNFPTEERLKFLVETYGHFEKEGVINSLNKIAKRLGGQHAKAALEFYEAGNLYEATKLVLVYYDKSYNYGLSQRISENIYEIKMNFIVPAKNAEEILLFVEEKTIKSTINSSFSTENN